MHLIQLLVERGEKVVCITRGKRQYDHLGDSVVYLTCDVGASGGTNNFAIDSLTNTLQNAYAIVNLVGIKKETDIQTFEVAHVEVTRKYVCVVMCSVIYGCVRDCDRVCEQ